MRTLTISAYLLTLLMGASLQVPAATLEQQLESEYKLTTPTADNSDIVTMGSILILQKKGFSAGSVSSNVVTQNTYKDGQIRSGAATAIRRFGHLPGIGYIPGVGTAAGTAAGTAGESRDFVNGEKLYVTKITVDRGKDDIAFDLISDAYGDAGRYKGSLRIQFPKRSLVSADLATVDTTIGEVLKIQPEDANSQQAPAGAAQEQGAPAAAPAAPAAAPPAQQADAPPAPIPPPPPPVDEPPAPPKTISLGQTKDQVISSFGQPKKTAKVGAKEIYFYDDLKVTFLKGKVTDVQ
ncbi:MAG: hypothetical protein WBE37_25320 [Bryobacteraceae bacterium]